MDKKELIAELRTALYAKAIPGKLLNDIMEKKLKEFASQYDHDHDALWVGAYLADLFIVEARTEKGNHMEHVPMASEYAKKEIFPKYGFTDEQKEIILEIIETHHGGEQKHIESKLFTNADCFKFLEPEGVFHLFGAYYIRTKENFKESIQAVMFKLDEKYNLVNLNDEVKKEADELYTKWKFFLDRMGYELEIPEIYKKR